MRSRSVLGALVGLLSAAVGLGVGELAAAFVRPAAAPVVAVGNRIILLTPETVKRTTIQAAGTNDKIVLIGGILVLLAVFSALLGQAAMRRLWVGVAGTVVLGAFGVYCALTAHASRGTDVIPTIVATAASVVALVILARVAEGAAVPDEGAGAGAATSAGAAPVGTAGGTLRTDRRRFLWAAVSTAALAGLAAVGGRAEQRTRFSAADARAKVELPPAPGVSLAAPAGADLGRSGVPWVTPNNSFYRIDTALELPQIDPADWQLRIHGMVDHELTLTYRDVLARPLVERWITLCCVSNEVGGPLIGNALFRGVLLADLLREAGVHGGSDQLLLTSVDGMTIGAPTKVVTDGRSSLLAIGMNGAPLPIEHGFPARTVVPGLYGYVSACKWIVDIEATTFAAHSAYWVQGGWAEQGPVRLESRIDTPTSNKVVTVGRPVAVAGVAWDQHVGVSRVEVQVDDGAWNTARLAAVPSTDTWRQWVWSWTPTGTGVHRLRVRAFDAHGTVQTAASAEPFPSGATGYDTIHVRAR